MSTTTFRINDAYQVMAEQASAISDNVFTGGRPKMIPEYLEDFVCISLPVMLYDKLVGDTDGIVNSYVRYEIYVRDINGVENLPKITRLSEELLALFPITSNSITIYRPRIAMKGSDDHNFHYAWIQASITIY